MIERYTTKDMEKVWSLETRFKYMLKIEILVCEALSLNGKVPQKALQTIKKKARFNIKKINKIESRVYHDVIAFITSVAESVGKYSRYIHQGLTSYDVVDTALSRQLRDSCDLILGELRKTEKILKKKAQQYKMTPMIGRTHGVHAEPITFGLKMALWHQEILRNITRIDKAKEIIGVGKISGAVGNYAHLGPDIENYVLGKLGLQAAPVSSQVIQRDRHAEYLMALAICGSSIEKFATELRNLARTEVREVEEPFLKGQKGSSAMPHKRNPIVCERLCGLARLVRASVTPALENMSLWHERDISHSSVERVILPDTSILMKYMLEKFNWVMDNLLIYPEKMEENMHKTSGLIFSQRLLLRLTEKGMSRENAYRIVQRIAMKGWAVGNFKRLVLQDKEIRKHLTIKEIEDSFSLDWYLRNVDKIFKRIGM